jgi:hypothetical protein
VVGRGVEDGGARAVGRVARVGGDLDGEDRLAEQRGADLDELDDVAVIGRQLAQLVGDAAGLGVAAEDVVVRVRAVAAGEPRDLRRELRQRLLVEVDALGLELGGRGRGERELDLLLAGRVGLVAGFVELYARVGHDGRLGGRYVRGVGLQRLGSSRHRGCGGEQRDGHGQQGCAGAQGESPS